MDNFILQGLMGITSGMYLWMVAAGLALAFGVIGILNVAHGSFYMLGAFFLFTFYHLLGMNFGLSLILALASLAIVGALMERFFLRRVYNQPLEFQLILTFAFLLIFDGLARLIWGTAFTLVRVPNFLDGTVSIMGSPFPVHSVFIIFSGIALFIAISLGLGKTWWGKTIRAAASDREMANAIGINIRTLFTSSFAAAAAVAALGGALSLPATVVNPGLGGEIIIPAFVVTVVGTLGNMTGAFIGALIVGVAAPLLHILFPGHWGLYAVYLIMAIILIVRPQGLFGETR